MPEPDLIHQSGSWHDEDALAFRGLAPGWYRDLTDPSFARYWDGMALGPRQYGPASMEPAPAAGTGSGNGCRRVTYRGGLIGSAARESRARALEQAVAELNASGIRVVGAIPDRWGVGRRIAAAALSVVTLGLVGRTPDVILITDEAGPEPGPHPVRATQSLATRATFTMRTLVVGVVVVSVIGGGVAAGLELHHHLASSRSAPAPGHRPTPSMPPATSTGATLSASQIEARLRRLFHSAATSVPGSRHVASPAPSPSPAPTGASPTTRPAPSADPSPSPSTAPTVSVPSGTGTNPNGVPTYALGQTGTFWDPGNLVYLAAITVSAPSFTATDESGDPSAYGYFATFEVTVTNVAPASSEDTLAPFDSDYFVMAGGADYGFAQTNSGNTAEAEGADYLGNDLPADGLLPGQSTTGTVTVDVPSTHGSLVYAPTGSPLGAWTF